MVKQLIIFKIIDRCIDLCFDNIIRDVYASAVDIKFKSKIPYDDFGAESPLSLVVG